MASEAEVEPLPELDSTWSYWTGAVSGVVATALVGVVITVVDVEVIQVGVAGLYGFEGSLVVGWLAHLFHGTLFGVLFAAVVADPAFHEISDQRWKTSLLGLGYGLVLAVGGTGIIMPIWLSAVGGPVVGSLPYLNAATLLWHLLYGAVLGGLYAVVARR